MPKPIKKRVSKKSAEKEVFTVYEICKNYYLENKRFVHLAVFAFFAIILLGIITISYINKKSEEAHELLSEGYKLYSSSSSQQKESKQGLKEALEKFKEAYEKDHSAELLYYIANTQYKLGNLEEALKSLNEIIEEFKDNKEILPLAYLKKATILLKQKKKEEALKALEALYNSNTEYLKDVALYEQAQILESLGKKEDAKKKYEQIVQKFPSSPYKPTAEAKIKPEEKKERETKSKKEKQEKEKNNTTTKKK